ncbi:fluoride efflux transporter CrcB [Thermoproteota archaeon]
MMTLTALYVAAGGALGAVGRFWLSSYVSQQIKGVFPWGTVIVNLVGCFFLGLLWGALPLSNDSPLRLAIIAGFLGALTTFSTFTFDIIFLASSSKWESAILYFLISAGGGLVMTLLGLALSGQLN